VCLFVGKWAYIDIGFRAIFGIAYSSTGSLTLPVNSSFPPPLRSGGNAALSGGALGPRRTAMRMEDEFVEHYKRFHDYMAKARVLLDLYPTQSQKRVFRSWVDSVPRETDCIIKCLKISDPRVIRILREWETPCRNRALAHEIVDQNAQCHFVADIAYLFWRYSDIVHHLRIERDSRKRGVRLILRTFLQLKIGRLWIQPSHI
jgi:hypothetical protein